MAIMVDGQTMTVEQVRDVMRRVLTFGGGPAFPIMWDMAVKGETPQRFTEVGLTMRDWFAGQALVGILLAVDDDRATHKESLVSGYAYQYADAMLAERAKGGAS